MLPAAGVVPAGYVALMARYKYSDELLRAAVAASSSMAGVLRYLDVPLNGGMHAHLRHRIDAAGIDRTHFRRPPGGRGVIRARQPAEEILVLRDRRRRRADPGLLRRALTETGVPARCAICGLGPSWQERALTLQVDHISGEFWDCRPANLRLLCPNCHSQTATYAGRNRRILDRDTGSTGQTSVPLMTSGGAERDHLPRQIRAEPPGCAAAGRPSVPVNGAGLVELLTRVDRRELSATAAAHLIGCHRSHLHRLRQQLTAAGLLAPRSGARRWRSQQHRETVLAFALANPELGPKTIARRLREIPDRDGGCLVSHGTVSNILRAAGLNTVAARRSRLVGSAGVA